MQSIKTICICGAGTMGSGIAQVCVTAGYHTILYDVDEKILKKAKSTIETNIKRLIEKGKIIAADTQEILRRIKFTSDIAHCNADLVIEAIVEKTESKISLFHRLVEINGDHTMLATNTSSLSITKIAESLKRPENLIGLHFFNPAPLMKLVEIIKTKYVTKETIETAISFASSLNKVGVVCKDSPGFIVNRVARPYYIESLRLIEEEKINFENLDKVLEDRGFKMGPFKLMDVIGNDINYAVSTSVYEQLNKPTRLKPSFIQKEKVEKAMLGKKTGFGYYNYNANLE
jgi:3-hydroxybutyryl-CoA dehydrogenase